MHRKLLSCAAMLTLAVAGCHGDRPDGSTSPSTGEKGSTIISGALDGSHQAVAALVRVNAQGYIITACSGTIVHVTSDTGFLLTAAHCVLGDAAQGLSNPTPDELRVIQGNDYTTAQLVFPVSALKSHPYYMQGQAASPYDFGMVTFLGAGPTTPTIAPITPAEDTLSVGTQVNLIGYGKTAPTDTNMNSQRYAITLPLNDVNALQISYSETSGGTCQGDSGGPALVKVGGQERVAGVSSFVVDGCATEGTSGRVSAVYDWIQGYITGSGGTGTQTCAQCQQAAESGAGKCVDTINACVNDPACKALLDCENGCNGDSTCLQNCATQNPNGVAKRNAIGDCVCTTACPTQCSMECAKPMCGFTYQNAGCETCANASCCDAGAACANDTACQACATAQTPDPSCQQNALYTSFIGCLGSKCSGADKCGGSSAKCGFSFNDATCGTCVETSCCDAATACANDATCNMCETSMSPPASCKDNALVKAFEGCYVGTCGKSCGAAQCGFTADPTCQSCFESKCCDVTSACSKDATCSACATGKTKGAECDASAAYQAFGKCLGGQCGAECGGGSAGAGGTSSAGGSGGTTSAGGSGGTGPATGGSGGTGPATGGSGGSTSAGGSGQAAGGQGQGAGGSGQAGGPAAGGSTSAGGSAQATGGAAGKTSGASGAATAGAGGSSAQQAGYYPPPAQSDSGGCGCQVPAGPAPSRGLALGTLGALALLRRRRAAK